MSAPETNLSSGRYLLAVYLTMIPAGVFSAWVLSVLWRWFVIPATGWPAVSVAVAFGLLVVVAHVRSNATEDTPNPAVPYLLAKSLGSTAASLGLGWMAVQFT